jgi:DnaJ family protein C protein 28
MNKGDHAVDEIIRRAMERGDFDNLPGKGKPLKLQKNPYEDPTWSMAFRALQSSGFTLPWMEARRQIERDLEAARHSLYRSWKWRESALAEGSSRGWVEVEWNRAVDEFREKINALNERIFSYNLEVPSELFQRQRINYDRELKKITSGELS